MIKELFYKLFRLDPPICDTCEVLRTQLEKSEVERKELLHLLLKKDQPVEPVTQPEVLEPILPKFVPWRVRQQMLEAEDRKKAAQLRADKEKEIASLEKELGINDGDQRVQENTARSN